jgi:hypothetical protein
MGFEGDYRSINEFIYEEFRFDVQTSKLIRCGSTKKEFGGKEGVTQAMRIAGVRSFSIPVFINDPAQPIKAMKHSGVNFCSGFSPMYPIGIWDMSNLITNPMRTARKKFGAIETEANLFLIESVMCLAFEASTLHPTTRSTTDIEAYGKNPNMYASYVELICQLFNIKDLRGRSTLVESMERITGNGTPDLFEIRKQTPLGVKRSVLSYFCLERVAVGVEEGCVLKYRPNYSIWKSPTYLMDVEVIGQAYDDRIGLTTEQLMDSVASNTLPNQFNTTSNSIPVFRIFKKGDQDREKD